MKVTYSEMIAVFNNILNGEVSVEKLTPEEKIVLKDKLNDFKHTLLNKQSNSKSKKKDIKDLSDTTKNCLKILLANLSPEPLTLDELKKGANIDNLQIANSSKRIQGIASKMQAKATDGKGKKKLYYIEDNELFATSKAEILAELQQ